MGLKAVWFDAKAADALIEAGLGAADNSDESSVKIQAIGGGLLGGVLQTLLMEQLKKFLESGQLQTIVSGLLAKLVEQLLGGLKGGAPVTPAGQASPVGQTALSAASAEPTKPTKTPKS